MADPDTASQDPAQAPDPAAPASPAKPDGKTARRQPEPREKRPLLVRLFAISPWGAFKLVLLCILVGAIVMAANFDPRSPDVDMGAMASSLARDAWNAAVWAVRNFWRPALAGAGIVLPVWVLWRLASLPFRK